MSLGSISPACKACCACPQKRPYHVPAAPGLSPADIALREGKKAIYGYQFN